MVRLPLKLFKDQHEPERKTRKSNKVYVKIIQPRVDMGQFATGASSPRPVNVVCYVLSLPIIPWPLPLSFFLRESGWCGDVLPIDLCDRPPCFSANIAGKNTFDVFLESLLTDSKLRKILLRLLHTLFAPPSYQGSSNCTGSSSQKHTWQIS